MLKKLFNKCGNIFLQLFDVNHIIPKLILPALYLAFCCFSFGFVLFKRHLTGSTFYFVMKMSLYLMIYLGVISIIYLLLKLNSKKQKREKVNTKIENQRMYFSDIIFLLLPLTPITQYIINNLNILIIIEIVKIVIFFVLLASIFSFGLPLLLSHIVSRHTLFALGLGFSFTVFNMAVLSHNLPWFFHVKVLLPALILIGIFLLLYFLQDEKYKKILYVIIIINFIFSGFSQLISLNSFSEVTGTTQVEKDKALVSYLEDKDPVVLPNIYFLIYESYVPEETMLGYGIDNSAQEQYLIDQGFVIYPGVYTIGSPSIESISRVLNVSTQLFGNPRRAVSGDGVVQEIIGDLGYQTYGIFAYDWFFRNIESNYDNSFPTVDQNEMGSDQILIRSILNGDFSLDVIFDHGPKAEYLEVKRMVLENSAEEKSFIYSHSSLPNHARHMGVDCSTEEIQTYKENLPNANNEMKQDIEQILQTVQDPIIIIAGDHGPYLTKNCFGDLSGYPESEITRLDIQDRFATFLAIKWPNEGYEQYDDISILQDLFPAIFAYIYDDESILDFKIEPEIINTSIINGVTVKDGIIFGGANDGEPLFLINE